MEPGTGVLTRNMGMKCFGGHPQHNLAPPAVFRPRASRNMGRAD